MLKHPLPTVIRWYPDGTPMQWGMIVHGTADFALTPSPRKTVTQSDRNIALRKEIDRLCDSVRM